MMASNLLSRLLPANGPSIYDHMRAEEEGLNIDEENLNGEMEEFLDNPDAFGNESHITHTIHDEEDDLDNQVPASLLIEGNEDVVPLVQRTQGMPRIKAQRPSRTRAPEPETSSTQAKWNTTQAHQRLHPEDDPIPTRLGAARGGLGVPLDAYQSALWTWINASNLDFFMSEMYSYYQGNGMYSICLSRGLYVLTVVFVTVFTTFLTQCVNYRIIPSSTKLSEILVEQCAKEISGVPNVVIWCMTLWVIWKIYLDLVDLRRLWAMHNFFLHLLMIPDSDIQTVSWPEIVKRTMDLRERHPLTAAEADVNQKYWMAGQSKERLDAHDIANRIMRRDNYLIALINKDILNLTLPIPFLGNQQIFSRSIEWCISQTVLDFMFNNQGQVHQMALKESHRKELSTALRQRFIFAGFMSFLSLPVVVPYLMISYFFTYFNEYQKNPSAISSRQYTPLAEWTFREFNELPHFFEERMNMSYPFASRYIDQFPKAKTVAMARFVAFIAGALGSVLALATLFDPELFLTFEITPGRTALFYLGTFGFIWATARGIIPEDNFVFQPEYAIRNVIDYTHYCPVEWENKLHSDDVRREFSTMYKMKIVIFINEILSMFLTPLILWFCLPDSSEKIVDFFREFTVHVDGLGYICSFAMFDFKKGVRPNGGRIGSGAGDPLRDDYYSTKHGKMAASFMGFLDNYVLNPKTGIPGHVPPGMRHQQFHPPPNIPDLRSPTHGGDVQQSRTGSRNTRYRGQVTRDAATPGRPSKTPRFSPSTAVFSPMASMLLDPAHQPSVEVMERGRKRATRSMRLPPRVNSGIAEADEEQQGGPSRGPYKREVSGLDESVWETSPTRVGNTRGFEDEQDEGPMSNQGVVGLVTQYLKKDGKGPVVQI